ncbi:MAG: hypothetical protein GKS07_02765 [Nitrosopumilus sp.]|nr:MAG: hypothetical protein GKS07_02765 [Nitrosopumilus sp.]
MDIIFKDKKNIPEKDWIEIHYEDFVRNPQENIKDIFDRLDLEFTEYQLNICKKVENKVNKKTMAKSDKTTVLDHPFRIGRYKKELTAIEIKKIEEIMNYK